MTAEHLSDDQEGIGRPAYKVDTRPLCQGMPFVLTDAAHPRLVLKHGSHFLVMDQSALVPGCNTLGYGYYRYDTRHLSQWEITLNGLDLSLLSSSVAEGYAGTFLYTNVQSDIPQQKVTLQREIVLSDLLWERLTLQNFHNQPLELELKMKFQSDFADMFEVRGLNLPDRGLRMRPEAGENGRSLFLAYRGKDDDLLETVIEFFGMQPADITDDGEIKFNFVLPIHEPREIQLCVTTRWEDVSTVSPDVRKTGFSDARKSSDDRYRDWCNRATVIKTGHDLFDMAVDRAMRDLYILRQPTPRGFGLSAGIPWYTALFGRDSAITAWQVLPFLPDLARECIEVLAAYQGNADDKYKAEAPGKIMHELRLGEMARTGQIPHSPYYGTIDATALWLYVLAEYVDWSGDLGFASNLWPAVKLALAYMDGALNSSGYLAYRRESVHGLENQGWKDSGDSVMHIDGTLATAPIALCEVQGYLYAAWMRTAKLARQLGHEPLAEKLEQDSASLRQRFERDFWMESEGYVALALDGENQQVGSISSNPGHLLFTGILDDEKAHLVADRLMSPELLSGWGIRTLSRAAVAYNPISYHNGSVWPHDNAIIAEGMRKLGRVNDAHRIMLALLEACQFQPDFRLPELFCGFERNGSHKPIDYPVSCSPQAWAAGAILQLLKTCANFQHDGRYNLLRVVDPSLPGWMEKFTVQGLRVGRAIVGLNFINHEGGTSCQVLHRSGKVRIVIET